MGDCSLRLVRNEPTMQLIWSKKDLDRDGRRRMRSVFSDARFVSFEYFNPQAVIAHFAPTTPEKG